MTSSGFGPWITSIPGFRYFGGGQTHDADALPVVPGDRITMRYDFFAEAVLPPGATGGVEIIGRHEGTADFGLTPVECTPPECSEDAACGVTQICDHGTCKDINFLAPPLDINVTTNPSPFAPGQPFSVGIAFDVHAGDLQPYEIELGIEQPALDFTGVATPNQVLGTCAVAPALTRLILSTADAAVAYVDLDGNAVPGPGDPTITVSEGASELTIHLVIPDGGDGDAAVRTLPADARVSCQGFFGRFTPGPAGEYPGVIRVTSIDPSSGGADDGTGLAPLTRTFPFSLADGAFGVSSDSDGDGVPDDEDGCPQDPAKIVPGICGCGTPDVDGDGDGTADCNDQCPTDPEKTQPGFCGCGVGDDEDGMQCDTGLAGPCTAGIVFCLQGASVCSPLVPPAAETCNGVDDDCDGAVDEGACEETVFESLRGTLTLDPKPKKDKISLQGTFPWTGLVLDPAAAGLNVSVETNPFATGQVQIPSGVGWKTKVNKKGDTTYTFKDARDGSLGEPSKDAVGMKCKVKKQTCTGAFSP